MADYDTYTPVRELEAALPILQEKEQHGLIKPSHRTAADLVNWSKTKPLTEKQRMFVSKLLERARRKHPKSKLEGLALDADPPPIIQQASVDVDDIVKQVCTKMEGKLLNIDTQDIVKKALVELEKRKPREVIVTLQNGDKKKGIKGHTHKQFEHLAKAASVRLSNGLVPGIFLQGEASSGKTTGCKQLAELMGLKWHFNGAITFPHEMLGFIDGAGHYHRTPFREAYEHGGVYTFDEVDRSDPVALLAVNPHLAGDVATFPDKQIKRHKDCILTATANTWGLGADANYSGATKLDAAFLSRYPLRISWDIDPILEGNIVTNVEWLEKVRKARERARTVGLKVLIDTRTAQAGAALITIGYSMDEAAELTYLANLKPEQKQQLKG